MVEEINKIPTDINKCPCSFLHSPCSTVSSHSPPYIVTHSLKCGREKGSVVIFKPCRVVNILFQSGPTDPRLQVHDFGSVSVSEVRMPITRRWLLPLVLSSCPPSGATRDKLTRSLRFVCVELAEERVSCAGMCRPHSERSKCSRALSFFFAPAGNTV